MNTLVYLGIFAVLVLWSVVTLRYWFAFRNIAFLIMASPFIMYWRGVVWAFGFTKWYFCFICNCFLYPVTGDWLPAKQWGLLGSGLVQVILEELGIRSPLEIEGELWRPDEVVDKDFDEWYDRVMLESEESK